jgi:hypothetical protein
VRAIPKTDYNFKGEFDWIVAMVKLLEYFYFEMLDIRL